MLGGGVLASMVIGPGKGPWNKLMTGLGYTLSIAATVAFHAIGHILGGRLVGAPMWANLLTATLPINQYRDDQLYPSRVHLGRALGGGLANLSVGALLLAANGAVGGHHFLRFGALTNLGMWLVAWSPLPSLDGRVVVRELRNWRSG
jgi:hypothetical protein